MTATAQKIVRLSEPYCKTIGKVTFQVSAFANPHGTDTAQQLMLRSLESRTAE